MHPSDLIHADRVRCRSSEATSHIEVKRVFLEEEEARLYLAGRQCEILLVYCTLQLEKRIVFRGMDNSGPGLSCVFCSFAWTRYDLGSALV